MPVLKSHSGAGVTACVKHYMGFVSQSMQDNHSFIWNGGLAAEMARVRFPTLNILDATCTNPHPKESGNAGPSTSYSRAVYTNRLIAGLDPIAIDYWASKNILLPSAQSLGYSSYSSLDPDSVGQTFHDYLVKSVQAISAAGIQATMDVSHINLHTDQCVADSQPVYSVVRGMDNRVYQGAEVASCWIGWAVLPGATLDSPATARQSGKLHITLRGTGSGIYCGDLITSTGEFSGWVRTSGSTASAPALAASETDSMLYLVVRGMNDGIFLNFLPNGGAWSGWSRLPGSTVDGPAATVTGSVLHIAVRGADGSSIWHGRFNRDTMTWIGWERVSGSTLSKPALAAVSDTEVYLAVRGTGNRIYVNKWNGATWTGWNQIPTGSTPNGSSILAINSQLYVAVRGSDGGIYCCKRPLASGPWSSWTRLPGSTPSSPAIT